MAVKTALLVFTARRYASAVYAMVLCLSVCPSITSRWLIKMATCIITQIKPHDSQGTLVFWRRRPWWNSIGVVSNGSAKYIGLVGKTCHFRQLHLENGTRYRLVQFLWKVNEKSCALSNGDILPVTLNLWSQSPPAPNFHILGLASYLRNGWNYRQWKADRPDWSWWLL